MKLAKIRTVLECVKLLDSLGDRTITAWQVATLVRNTMSSATTYRYIRHMEKIGLIEMVNKGNVRSISTTYKGEEFLDAWKRFKEM